MQNGKYYWIKRKCGEWIIGRWGRSDTGPGMHIVASAVQLDFFEKDYEVGPEVIGHDGTVSNLRLSLKSTAQTELRDRFAMAAMTAMGAEMSPEDTAEGAYEYADAMMAERSKLKS